MSYFDDIKSGIQTTVKGLSLTLRHIRNATKRRTPEGVASDNYFDLQNGLVTLQYPHEQLPIPDNGRYRLRNEIDDCIVCDKCAKVCPVDCITIDAIKATEEVGRASDGSPIRLMPLRLTSIWPSAAIAVYVQSCARRSVSRWTRNLTIVSLNWVS